MTTRRQFVLGTIPVALGLAAASRRSFAQAAQIEESDPTAMALGYKHDATTVDAAKYPTFQAGRVCSGCQLYQGTDKDPAAPCLALGGKLVNANGWCTAWAAKA